MTVGDRVIRWVPLLIVLATGAVMGHFVWRTYFDYVPHLYPLNFREGQWIVVPDESPQGYFRKDLYIPETSKQAWLMVAATDSFVLYINGKHVDTQGYPMLNVSGIYDVGHYLHPGKNMISVQVTRVTFPGPARTVIEGTYFDQVGRAHPIVSDSSWKASSHEESQGDGSIPWYTAKFSTEAWPSVRVLGPPSASEVSPVSIHPDLLASAPQGKWIGPVDPKERSAIFYNTFALPQKVQGAWVRIAAAESYDLTINGIVVASSDTGDRNSETPNKTSGTQNRTLDIYDVGPFLRTGTNTIQVNVSALRCPSPKLILDGLIAIAGQAHMIFATDSTWKAKPLDMGLEGIRRLGQSLWQPPVVLADYSSWMDALVKNPLPSRLPSVYAGKQTVRMLACVFLILFTTLLIWVASSLLVYLLYENITGAHALMMDAHFHLSCLLFLTFIYLLQYDIRYDVAFPYQKKFIYLAIVLLYLQRLGFLFEILVHKLQSGPRQVNAPTLRVVPVARQYRALCLSLCILALTMISFTLRINKLSATSLSHDEASMAIFAQEILEDGYPAKTIGPIEKPLTTYELLPYPIALSIKLFSSSDFAVRLPAAIFGALTTCLIFYMGLQLSGVWVAILAAAIHACSPFSILWGGKAFHPQQTQFFALLTSYLFYRSISHESNAIEPKFLYGASLCFILTYLTWEGSGLLLPSFFCALLVIKGKDLSWLKCKHLWLAVCIVGMAVSLQLSRRIVLNFPYIVVGQGLSDAGFTLFFLSPSYDPWFYMQYFLFAGNHFIMTVLVILGGPLVLTNRDIRFYYSLMIVLLVLLTNFIPNLSTRYAYFIQPYLILTASLIMIHFIISVYRSQKIILFYVHIVTKYLCLFAFPLTMFLSTNTMMLHLYRLGKSPEWIIQMLPDIYGIDYRSTSRFLKNVLRQDATVISVMPHTLEYYGNWKSNYYLQSYTNRQILYDVSDISNNYLDKYIGAPVIRNISELNDIMNRHRTVYIVATPYAEIQSTNDKPILEFIAKNSRIVYESYRTRIYLWRR